MSANDPAETIEFPLIMLERIVALGAVPVTTNLQAATAVNRLFRQLMTLLSGGSVSGAGWASNALVVSGATVVTAAQDGVFFDADADAAPASFQLPQAAALRQGFNISIRRRGLGNLAATLLPFAGDTIIGPTALLDDGAALFVARTGATQWHAFATAAGEPGAAQRATPANGAALVLAATADGEYFEANATTGNTSLVLPDPATVRSGWNVLLRRADASANSVSIAAAAGVINGPAVLYGQNDALLVVRTSATAYAAIRIQYESRNNYTATTDPGPNNDVTQGYGYWSRWANTATGQLFACSDPTAGAAVWMSIGGGGAPPAVVNNGARLHRMPGNVTQNTAGVYSTAVSVPVAANSLYMIEYVLNYQNNVGSSATTIARLGLPAGATAWGVYFATQATAGRMGNFIDGADTPVFGCKAANVPSAFTAFVIVQTAGTAGNVDFDFTVGGASTTTFSAGGCAIIRDFDPANLSVIGAGGLTSNNSSDWQTLATFTVPANTSMLLRSALRWTLSGSAGLPRFRVLGVPSDCIVTHNTRRPSTSATTLNMDNGVGGRMLQNASSGTASDLPALQYLAVRTRETPATITVQFASNAAAQSCTMVERSLSAWREMGSVVSASAWAESDADWESVAEIEADAGAEYLAFGMYQWDRAAQITTSAQWRFNPPSNLVSAWYFAQSITSYDHEMRTNATATTAMSPVESPELFGAGFDAVFSGGAGGTVEAAQLKLAAAGGQAFSPAGGLTLVEELTLVP